MSRSDFMITYPSGNKKRKLRNEILSIIRHPNTDRLEFISFYEKDSKLVLYIRNSRSSGVVNILRNIHSSKLFKTPELISVNYTKGNGTLFEIVTTLETDTSE